MFSRLFQLIILAASLSGCVSLPPPGATPQQVQGWKLTQIEVSGSEVINSWPFQEKAYVESHKVDSDTAARIATESVQKSPELRDYVRLALQETVSRELRNALASELAGSRPVKAFVKVKTLDIPSALRRFLIENYARFNAEITIVDAQTGLTLAFYPGELTGENMLGGIGGLVLDPLIYSNDVAPRLMTNAFGKYKNWLTGR